MKVYDSYPNVVNVKVKDNTGTKEFWIAGITMEEFKDRFFQAFDGAVERPKAKRAYKKRASRFDPVAQTVPAEETTTYKETMTTKRGRKSLWEEKEAVAA